MLNKLQLFLSSIDINFNFVNGNRELLEFTTNSNNSWLNTDRIATLPIFELCFHRFKVLIPI